jgi:TRAP-type C4-dicarboxylate transport system substrate-binding protein
MKFKFKTALYALMGLCAASSVQAADVTLRLGHFWPAVSGPHKGIFQAWADTVEKESGGRIKVQVYPSQTLSKAPAQYEAVKNRIMDMTGTVLGYTANRFPLSQIVEFPGLTKSAQHGSCILQGLYDEGLLNSEFKDTKPIFMFTHGPGLLHTKGKLVKEPGDLAGMSIRRPTTLVAQILEGLGAKPVGMPAPQSYPAMQRGVINGASFPWEGALVFRLNELVKNHTDFGGLYNTAFVATMNKSTYNGLPADLKKIIDDNSGTKWANTAGKLFDAVDVKGKAQAEKLGHTIHVIEGGVSNPTWAPVLNKATEKYLADLEAKGLPARKVHARALELAKSCK